MPDCPHQFTQLLIYLISNLLRRTYYVFFPPSPGNLPNLGNDPDNHNDMITHLEPDILEFEVKWALGSITMNKASEGDEIPIELFQILKDDAVKVLHSICQQI